MYISVMPPPLIQSVIVHKVPYRTSKAGKGLQIPPFTSHLLLNIVTF